MCGKWRQQATGLILQWRFGALVKVAGLLKIW
jgi:hypothetical protein